MAKAFAGTTFINVRLGASDKKAVDAWAKEVNYDPVEFMFVAISDNYKISVSADLDKDCVICSITGKQQRGINAMKTMTSRGPDIDTALLITAYKHLKMFGGGEWVDEGDGDSWG